MDSPAAPRGSFEDEPQKLRACEENLRRYHQLAWAGRMVGATMHEVNNRLAALTNLIYLARIHPDSSPQCIEYLDKADTQPRSLGETTRRSLTFIRLDTEAKEVDLVDLATSALRLHHEQISLKRINVQIRSSQSASARVKKGEIFGGKIQYRSNNVSGRSGTISVYRCPSILSGRALAEGIKGCGIGQKDANGRTRADFSLSVRSHLERADGHLHQRERLE